MPDHRQQPNERSSSQNFAIALGFFIVLCVLFGPMFKYLIEASVVSSSRPSVERAERNRPERNQPNRKARAGGDSPGHQLAIIELEMVVPADHPKVKDFEYLLGKIERESSGYSERKIADMIVASQSIFARSGYKVPLIQITRDLSKMQEANGKNGIKMEELLGAYVTLAIENEKSRR